MPTNKHASFRYRILDQCFSNRGHRKWRLKDLVEEVSRLLQEEFGVDSTISQRTIQGDINVMRSSRPRGFDAPILCKDGFYFYQDASFSIEKNALSREELNILSEAVSLLRQLPGMPQMPALEMLLKRVNGAKMGALSTVWIQFETNPAVLGLEWLGPLYNAIAEKQVLILEYHPFSEPPLDILLHPYLLKEWHNRWYIFGRNSKDQLWNLALDRIKNISVLESVDFQENNLFNPEIWFSDIVGVSKPENGNLVDVHFETDYLSSKYLETRPIHPSQQLIGQEMGRYRFSLRVILNQELVNELARFGNDLTVVGPPELKNMVALKFG